MYTVLSRTDRMPSDSIASMGFVVRFSRPARPYASYIPKYADCSLSTESYGRVEVTRCLSHPVVQKATLKCVFFLFCHSKSFIQNIPSQFWRNQQSDYNISQPFGWHTLKSRVRAENRLSDDLSSSFRSNSTVLVAGGKEASSESIVDQRDVLEDLLAETEIGTVRASLKERLRESVEKPQNSFLLETSRRDSTKQDTDKNFCLTKLKGLVSPRVQGILLLNILTILYGSNVSVIKQSQTILDPATFSACRFAIASLAFSPFLWQALKSIELRSAGFELGLLASIGYLTQCVGLITTEAGHSAFISTFTVIVVPLLSGMLGAEIPKITWAAAAVSLLGVALLESGGAQASVGDLWSLSSALFFGIHMLRTEHHSRKLPADGSMSILSLQLFVIALFSTFWSFCSNAGLQAFVQNPQAFDGASLLEGTLTIPWLPLLYTGLVSTTLPLWIELVSMRNVSATEAAVIYTLEPLWGAGFAWSFLGERWGPCGWMGALLILGGSLTVQLFGRVNQNSPHVAIDGMDMGRHKQDDL